MADNARTAPGEIAVGWGRRLNLRWGVGILGGAIIAIIAGILVARAIDGPADARRTAEVTGEGMAQTLAEHVTTSLQSTDAVLVELGEFLAAATDFAKPGNRRIEDALARRLEDAPQVGAFLIIDRRGRLIHTTGKAPANQPDLADRKYFKAHPAANTGRAFVGAPMQDWETNGWVVPVSRRLQDKAGNFKGVVVATVDADHFANFYALLPRAHNAVIGLYYLDGTYVARHPNHHLAIGQSAAGSRLFIEFLARGAVDSFEDLDSDGKPSLVTYRAVRDFPFLVSVTSPIETVLANWRKEYAQHLVVGIGGAFAVLLLTLLVIRQIARTEASERRFANFAESASDWLWETDADLRFTYVSPRIREVAGIDPNALVGQPRSAIGRAADAELWREHADDLAKHRPFRDFVYSYQMPGDQVGYARDSGRPRFDRRGRFRGYRGVGSDVTSIRKADDQMRQRAREFHVFFEAAPIGMAIAWPDGRIQRVNAALAALLGHTPAELAGRGIADLAHPEDQAVSRLTLDRTLRGEIETPALELRLLGRGGAILHGLVTLSAVRDDAGQPSYLIVQVIDITERARFEDELRAAKDQAEAGNRAKSDFLANMSHELRTPLNAIIGFAEIMKNQIFGAIEPDKYNEYVHDIHASGQHLLNLINDILDLSRIEAGKLEVLLEVLSVQEECAQAMRLMAHEAESGGLTLVADMPDDDTRIVADRRAFRQILLNLLSNAIKFTPEGGKVVVNAKITDGHCAVRVTDTGIGISDRELARLGRPFEQVNGVYSRKQGGSGLGLALSKSLAELQGGRMHIRSRVGVGTTVSVELPVNRPGGQAAVAAAQ
jgi:PAS domain S-box-containing protein